MNNQTHVIVVGVAQMPEEDPWTAPTGEDPVLAPAVALAQRLRARLHVVRACERPDPVPSTFDDGTAARNRKLQIERCLWAQTRRFPPDTRIHCHVLEGRADLQLCAFAEEVEADLLIAGATRRGRGGHSLLGSTAEQLLRRATVPVLLIRHACDRPVQRVLLSTDLSELGPAIHEVALDTIEALFGDAPLEARALLVCPHDPLTAARLSQQFTTQAAASRLRQFLAERQRRRLPVWPRIRIGNPSTEILREADEWQADLLVLGSQSRRGIARLLLGSTAAAALRASSCNALVIPAPVAAGWQQRQESHRCQRQPAAAPAGTEARAEAGAPLTRV